jgi:hypothetical protein
MLRNEWTQVVGFANMGEDDESIFAKASGDFVQVAFTAYGGLKVIEISGIEDFSNFMNTEKDFSTIISECGDDWEVALPVVCAGQKIILVVDDLGDITAIPLCDGDNVPVSLPAEVTNMGEYDADEMEELDEDLLRKFNLV